MQNLNLNNLEANRRGAANSHKSGPHKGQFDAGTSASVQQKAADTRKEHSYLVPGNQRYEPPLNEIQHRRAMQMLVSELAAMGFEVKVTTIPTIWFGRGVQPVPQLNGPYVSGGKTYFGFSVR